MQFTLFYYVTLHSFFVSSINSRLALAIRFDWIGQLAVVIVIAKRWQSRLTLY